MELRQTIASSTVWWREFAGIPFRPGTNRNCEEEKDSQTASLQFLAENVQLTFQQTPHVFVEPSVPLPSSTADLPVAAIPVPPDLVTGWNTKEGDHTGNQNVVRPHQTDRPWSDADRRVLICRPGLSWLPAVICVDLN
jgi:hypothetical protein